MKLLDIMASLEENDDLHQARLLILVRSFAGPDGLGKVDGLTKLAKLDFLLRYPVYLERALNAKQKSTKDLDVASFERSSVESRMIRYRYGPWDSRYRRFINLLVAKGLAEVNTSGRTIQIGLTSAGFTAANTLAEFDIFADTVRRSKILKTHFDLQGTTLMRFIYQTFPEIASLSLGTEITT